MSTSPTLEQLHAVSDADLAALSALLIDCAEGGASVGFMNPLSRDRADAFWREVGATVATGGGAEGLYQRLGWQVVGQVPDYAMWPDGGLCATTIFYKSM